MNHKQYSNNLIHQQASAFKIRLNCLCFTTGACRVRFGTQHGSTHRSAHLPRLHTLPCLDFSKHLLFTRNSIVNRVTENSDGRSSPVQHIELYIPHTIQYALAQKYIHLVHKMCYYSATPTFFPPQHVTSHLSLYIFFLILRKNPNNFCNTFRLYKMAYDWCSSPV